MHPRSIDAAMVKLPVVRTRGSCCSVEPAITKEIAEDASTWLGVLADPTRLSMLATLRAAAVPICICDFVGAYGLTQPTISHHMGKLRRAGLVSAHKEGLWTYYQAAAPLPPMVEAVLANLTGDGRS